MNSEKSCNIIIFGIGISLIVIGLPLGLYGPTFFSGLYQDTLQLSPESTAFKLWLHTPIPLYLEVYLFNWTNAHEFVRNKSVVPHFEEVGPFVFKEEHDRVNLVWNDNNTVTYNQTRKWNFVPEESLDLSTEITNLNVITTTLSQLVKPFSKMKWVINFEFDRRGSLITTNPAKNWLFDGIGDALLDDLIVIEKMLHIPQVLKKFGWFYGRNMSSSYDGIFTIKTGSDSVYNVGLMDKWNRMNKTNYYGEDCGMVNGTSGEMFPPMTTAQDNITMFISDICSSITLHQSGSYVVKGIESVRYVGEKTTLDNGQINPGNKCFCKSDCAPYGARDVSACRLAPLFFSFPHFYQADESYRNSISGMMPNKSDHEFYIQLDLITGMPTEVRAQLQINVLLEQVAWLNMFHDVPKLYIPMLWFRQRASITPELALQALMIRYIPIATVGVCYGLISIGFIIIIARLCIILRRRWKADHDSELLIPPTLSGDTDTEDEKDGK